MTCSNAKNNKKFIMQFVFYYVGQMLCMGSIVQTFLFTAGFSESEVYVFNSITQIAQVVMMLAMMFLSPRIKRVKHVTALSYLSMAIMAAVFLLGAADRSVLGSSYIITVFIVAAVSYSGLGVYTVMSYCLPYYVMDMKEYGKVTATCAILSGVVSFAVSLLHTLLVAGMDYMQAMVAFFALAIISIIMTSVTCLLLKEKAPDLQVGRTAKDEVLAVFKNKDTYFLILPNFARGLSVGIMNVITVIAMANSIVNEQTASYINVLMQVAMLGGNLLYIVLYKRLSSRTILILSATLTSVFLPLCLGGGLEWFLTAFFVAYLMRMIVDTTIPVMITEIIPQNQIGAYTSIRMLIFTGAQAVATMIITPLVGIIGYVGLLIFAGAMQMVCGLAYWLVAKSHASKKEI